MEVLKLMNVYKRGLEILIKIGLTIPNIIALKLLIKEDLQKKYFWQPTHKNVIYLYFMPVGTKCFQVPIFAHKLYTLGQVICDAK